MFNRVSQSRSQLAYNSKQPPNRSTRFLVWLIIGTVEHTEIEFGSLSCARAEGGSLISTIIIEFGGKFIGKCAENSRCQTSFNHVNCVVCRRKKVQVRLLANVQYSTLWRREVERTETKAETELWTVNLNREIEWARTKEYIYILVICPLVCSTDF